MVIKLCVNYVNNQYIHCMRCHKGRGRGRYIRDIVSRRGHFSKIKWIIKRITWHGQMLIPSKNNTKWDLVQTNFILIKGYGFY